MDDAKPADWDAEYRRALKFFDDKPPVVTVEGIPPRYGEGHVAYAKRVKAVEAGRRRRAGMGWLGRQIDRLTAGKFRPNARP